MEKGIILHFAEFLKIWLKLARHSDGNPTIVTNATQPIRPFWTVRFLTAPVDAAGMNCIWPHILISHQPVWEIASRKLLLEDTLEGRSKSCINHPRDLSQGQYPWALTYLVPTFNLSGEGLTDAQKKPCRWPEGWSRKSVMVTRRKSLWSHCLSALHLQRGMFVNADSEGTEQGRTQTFSRTGFFVMWWNMHHVHILFHFISTLKAGYGNKALSFCVCVCLGLCLTGVKFSSAECFKNVLKVARVASLFIALFQSVGFMFF